MLAITSGLSDLQGVLTKAWHHLLPAMAPAPLPPDPPAHRMSSAQHLAGLHFAPPAREGSSTLAARVSGRKLLFPANEWQARWAQFDFTANRITFTLRMGRRTHTLSCGTGVWLFGTSDMQFGPSVLLERSRKKVAASGIWSAPDTVQLTLRCYETPFYRTITCRFSEEDARLEVTTNVSFGANELLKLVGHFS